MKLTVTTPTGVAYDGNADAIHIETDHGPITVYSHHASLITQTKLGEMRIVDGAHTHSFLIRGGVLSIDNKTNSAHLLSLSADALANVTSLSLKNYLEEIEKVLAEGNAGTSDLSYQVLHGDKIALERKISKLDK